MGLVAAHRSSRAAWRLETENCTANHGKGLPRACWVHLTSLGATADWAKGNPKHSTCQSDLLPRGGSRILSVRILPPPTSWGISLKHLSVLLLFLHLEHGNNNNADLIRWLFGLFKKNSTFIVRVPAPGKAPEPEKC